MVTVEEKFVVETLVTMLMNYDSEGIEVYDEIVCALIGMGSYSYALRKLDIYLKNRLILLAKPPI